MDKDLNVGGYMHLRDFRIGTRLGLGFGVVLLAFVGMLLAG